MPTITDFPVLYRREESRAIVANIRANPDDDVARLAYADWLEENADDDAVHRDHYAARAAFIRAGCCNPGKSLTRLNRAESKWLGGNWERLFPTLMQVHGYHNKENGEAIKSTPLLWRKGRAIRFEVYYHLTTQWSLNNERYIHPRDYAGYFTAHLRRGFIDAIDWHDNLPYWTRLIPAIAKDDPFACCRFAGEFGQTESQNGKFVYRIFRHDVGDGPFTLLQPTIFDYRLMPNATYEGNEQFNCMDRAYLDVDRASREWAEAAPITVSLTDAEFYGDIQSLAESMSV